MCKLILINIHFSSASAIKFAICRCLAVYVRIYADIHRYMRRNEPSQPNRFHALYTRYKIHSQQCFWCKYIFPIRHDTECEKCEKCDEEGFAKSKKAHRRNSNANNLGVQYIFMLRTLQSQTINTDINACVDDFVSLFFCFFFFFYSFLFGS